MLGLRQAVPSEQHLLNALPVPAPLLYFVEVASVIADTIANKSER
jgi:hypothetical protein